MGARDRCITQGVGESKGLARLTTTSRTGNRYTWVAITMRMVGSSSRVWSWRTMGTASPRKAVHIYWNNQLCDLPLPPVLGSSHKPIEGPFQHWMADTRSPRTIRNYDADLHCTGRAIMEIFR